MKRLSKVFLIFAVVLLGLSFTPFGSETLYDIPKPLALIFFGLFLITWILPRKDLEQFERDQALRKQMLRKPKERSIKGRPSPDRNVAAHRDSDPSSRHKYSSPERLQEASSMSDR